MRVRVWVRVRARVKVWLRSRLRVRVGHLHQITQPLILPHHPTPHHTTPLRDEFLQAVSENKVLVVVGETGSGKTTQVYLLTQY